MYSLHAIARNKMKNNTITAAIPIKTFFITAFLLEDKELLKFNLYVLPSWEISDNSTRHAIH